MTRDEILTLITRERDKRDAYWGGSDHVPLYWMGLVVADTGELARAAMEFDVQAYRKVLIYLAAVCLAALESLYRNELKETEDDKTLS